MFSFSVKASYSVLSGYKFSIFFVVIIFFVVPPQALCLSGSDIMLKHYNLDEGKDFQKTMQIQIIKKNGKKRIREIMYWKLMHDDGDRSLIRIIKPSSDKGTTFLIREHKDRESDQWLYLPVLKSTRKVSNHEKYKSFMGTDFSYNDLAMPHPKEFIHELKGVENINEKSCFVIDGIHKTYTDDPAYKNQKKYPYTKIRFWISRENYMMTKAEMFDQNNQPCKELHARQIKEIDGVQTAVEIEMINIKDQRRTIINVLEVKYNIGLTEDFFSL